MQENKDEERKRIYREIKSLHGKIQSLNARLTRLDTGAAEPFPFDPDYIPKFLRKDSERHIP